MDFFFFWTEIFCSTESRWGICKFWNIVRNLLGNELIVNRMKVFFSEMSYVAPGFWPRFVYLGFRFCFFGASWVYLVPWLFKSVEETDFSWGNFILSFYFYFIRVIILIIFQLLVYYDYFLITIFFLFLRNLKLQKLFFSSFGPGTHYIKTVNNNWYLTKRCVKLV